MPLIPVPGSDEIGEPEVVPEGEYSVTIVSVEEREERINQWLIRLSIDTDVVANPAQIRHYITLPNDGTPQEKINPMVLFAKRFCALFNIPWDGGFDPELITPGQTAQCAVTQSEYEGRVSNSLDLPPIPQGHDFKARARRRR